MLFLAYPLLVRTCLSMLKCYKVGHTRYLMADLQEKCFADRHMKYIFMLTFISVSFDKNIEFVVMCANCDRAVAESFCFPCGDGYCVDCFQSLHRKGKKKEHPETSIPRCHVCLLNGLSNAIHLLKV